MGRIRGMCILVILIAAAALLSFPWWGSQVQTILAADTTSTGLNVKITKVEIPANRRPVVTFRVSDNQGRGLSLTDLDGVPRFTIARIDTEAATGLTSYFNYVMINAPGRPFVFRGQTMQPALASAVQPASAMDPGGTFEGKGDGVHIYTFVSVLPEGYDRGATHALGMQATRETRRWAGNDVFYFVPAGGNPTAQREIVNVASCNRCHDPLALHGGSRRDTKLCVLCHTPQNTDPESTNTVDFKVMIHKIHRGANLPSVQAGKPYFIVGNAQNVFDFSEVVWPQDVRNCTTCHTNAPQADNWKNAPNAAACTSCHERVNPLTGENHPGGVQTNATCKNCHTNTMASEFDLSIPGAHLLPTRSQQLRGVNFALASFTNTKPGQNPTVTFNIKDRAGNSIAPSEMSTLSLILSGPTSEFQVAPPVSESALRATDVGGGNFSHTFAARIPEGASGSWAVGIEGYIGTVIQKSGGVTETVRDAGFNRVMYSPVTDAVAMPRKLIVSRTNCNQCHEDLGNPAGRSIHGGIRRNTELCVLCHNPNLQARADAPRPASAQFKILIHRVHMGEEGSEPYVLRTRNLGETRFPGDQRNCGKCHLPGSQLIDFLHVGAQPTNIMEAGKVVQTIQPITAACTACHDSQKVKDHASLQTTREGSETCILCHGEGRDFAVSKVHARP